MIAIWWPKLRDSVTTFTRGSCAAISARIAGVPSLEPSSTMMSSHGSPSHAARTRSQKTPAVSSSLSIGATTLTRDRCRSTTR